MRIVIALIGPTAVLALASCTHVADRSATRFIDPSGLAPSTQYTHVVETTGDRTVYVSGQVALDGEGNLVGEGDFGAQARRVFENLGTALASVGAGFDDIVKITMYVTDMSEVETLREIRGQFMTPPPPATTLVQVVRLARGDFLVEVEAIAVLPE